jgi:hypothetical protein
VAKPFVYVVEAEIALHDGCDPAALGAAVTIELCGRIKHAGPCVWPHNSAIDASTTPALFRTVFVSDPTDELDVRMRIESSLRAGEDWQVMSVRERPLHKQERKLASNLQGGPRAPQPR